MISFIKHKQNSLFNKILTAVLTVCFVASMAVVPGTTYAQSTVLNLPAPGSIVSTSASFAPVSLQGVKINPSNPLEFDFVIHSGDSNLEGYALEEETEKLIKYFLAALTVPEESLWVNLSPYEENRIVDFSFGQTEMGQDMLAQDYLLKQLTASLTTPDNEVGQEFWTKVYERAATLFGTTEIPTNTFNKIWIVPEYANIYEQNGFVYVADSHLKVMLEEDYLAKSEALGIEETGTAGAENAKHEEYSEVSSKVLREIIVPAIEEEVNSGEHFAPLRQMFNALVLAKFYKNALEDSVFGDLYINQSRIGGVEVEDKMVKHKIYEQYVSALRKGVYNNIKEEYDPIAQEIIPRKYFSGGVDASDFAMAASRDEQRAAHQEFLQEEIDAGNISLGSADLSPDNAITADNINWDTKDNGDVDLKANGDIIANLKKIDDYEYEATPINLKMSDATHRETYYNAFLEFLDTEANRLGHTISLHESENARTLGDYLKKDIGKDYTKQKGVQVYERDFVTDNLYGKAVWHGGRRTDEAKRFFSLTYRKRGAPEDRGNSHLTFKVQKSGKLAIRVQPETYAVTIGWGTIGGDSGAVLRQTGLKMIVAQRSPDDEYKKANTALKHGYMVIPTTDAGVQKYIDAKKPVYYIEDGEIKTQIHTDNVPAEVQATRKYISLVTLMREDHPELPKIKLGNSGADGKSTVAVDANNRPVFDKNWNEFRFDSERSELTEEARAAGAVKIKTVTNGILVYHQFFFGTGQKFMLQGSDKTADYPEIVPVDTQILAATERPYDSIKLKMEDGEVKIKNRETTDRETKLENLPDCVKNGSCNTTGLLGMFSPLYKGKNRIVKQSLKWRATAHRRQGDRYLKSNANQASQLPVDSTNYHHAGSALAVLEVEFDDGSTLTYLLAPARNQEVGEFSIQTNATIGAWTEFHFIDAWFDAKQVNAATGEEEYLDWREYRRILQQESQVTVVDTGGGKFDSNKVAGVLTNKLERIHAYTQIAYVYPSPEGIGLAYLVPQETNVIRNVTANGLLLTGLIGPNNVEEAIHEANSAIGMNKIKDDLEEWFSIYETIRVEEAEEIVRNIADMVKVNGDSIEVLDEDKLIDEGIGYLDQEAHLGLSDEIKAEANRILDLIAQHYNLEYTKDDIESLIEREGVRALAIKGIDLSEKDEDEAQELITKEGTEIVAAKGIKVGDVAQHKVHSYFRAERTYQEQVQPLIDEIKEVAVDSKLAEFVEKSLVTKGSADVKRPKSLQAAAEAQTPYIVGANYKMALENTDAVRDLITETVTQVVEDHRTSDFDATKASDVVFIVSFAHLQTARETLDVLLSETVPDELKALFKLGVEDISPYEPGARTGDTSTNQLKEFDVTYVLVGHSERRHGDAQESDELIARKAKRALDEGYKVIFAYGETKSERLNGKTNSVIARQLMGLKDLDVENIVPAYEPVWAIGTGLTATPEQANDAIEFSVAIIGALKGATVMEDLSVEYGGSVNPGNVAKLFAQPFIKGALVGGASLKAETFSPLAKAGIAQHEVDSADAAMAVEAEQARNGGINLNPQLFEMNDISSEGIAPVTIDVQKLEQMRTNFNGFTPVINTFIPVTSPLLLGISNTEQPFDAAKTEEYDRVSYLDN